MPTRVPRKNPRSEPVRTRTDPRRSRLPDRFWPIVAIVAIIAATSGWTTVAVATVFDRDVAPTAPTTGATDAPVDPSLDPGAAAESHEAADLEALLPTEHDGTILTAQSWTGDTVLAGDEWSAAFQAFLESEGKVPSDLAVAQAWDPTEALDLVVGAFRVEGSEPASLIDTMSAAWLANDETFKTTGISLAGQPVTRGSYDDGTVTYYWYAGNGVVYDIETSDEAVATAVIAGLAGGATASPDPSPTTATPSPATSPSP
jgi:hypothetical protein